MSVVRAAKAGQSSLFFEVNNERLKKEVDTRMVYYGMDKLLSLSDELIGKDAKHASESTCARALLLDLRVRHGIEAISERGLQAIGGMEGVLAGADAVARRFEGLGGDMESGDNPYALTAAGVERINAVAVGGAPE